MGQGAGLSAGATLGEAYSNIRMGEAQADAQRAQTTYEKHLFDMNARFAEMKAQDAIQRGDKEAILFRREVKKTLGAQRASYAAQGVEVDDGSAKNVQLDTISQGEMQILTIKNNAYREAWGYKVEALNATTRGKFAAQAGEFAARNTVLTGYLNAAGTISKAATKAASYGAAGAGGG